MSETSPPPAPAPPGPAAQPAPPGVVLASLADFQKLQLRTAQIVEARPHPKADRLVIMQIQVGEKSRQIVAGLRPFYTPEQLTGRGIIVVDNLAPARLRGELSEGMLLAVRLPEGGLRLLTTDGPAPTGLEVS